jgi:hypothetical protein
LIHNPDRNDWAMTLLDVALRRSFCAACSVAGATNSPTRKVSTESSVPIWTRATAMFLTESPDTRITVNSECATICARANKVPINAATGRIS